MRATLLTTLAVTALGLAPGAAQAQSSADDLASALRAGPMESAEAVDARVVRALSPDGETIYIVVNAGDLNDGDPATPNLDTLQERLEEAGFGAVDVVDTRVVTGSASGEDDLRLLVLRGSDIVDAVTEGEPDLGTGATGGRRAGDAGPAASDLPIPEAPPSIIAE